MPFFRRTIVATASAVALSLLVVAGAQGIAAWPASPSGGGGSPPDLVITKTASRTTALVGDLVIYYVKVSLKPDAKITATATEVVVTDILPGGVTLLSTYSDRGPGCSGTTALSCNLDFLSGVQTATITIRTQVTQTGAIVNTASVRAHQTDPDLSNNSASATVTVTTPTPPAPPPPPPAPPRLVRSGPAALQASRSGEISFLLFVSEPATVGVKAADRTGAALELAPGSRLAGTGTQTPVASLTTSVAGPKVVRVKLRFEAGELGKGKRYRAIVQATDRDGQTATLSVPFRG